MKNACRGLVVMIAVSLGSASAHAQEPAPATPAPATCPGARMLVPDLFSVRWELTDVLKLAGAAPAGPVFLERPSSLSRLPVCRDKAPVAAWAVSTADTIPGSQARLWPVIGELVRNSGYPKDENNGAMWAGVGANVAGTALALDLSAETILWDARTVSASFALVRPIICRFSPVSAMI